MKLLFVDLETFPNHGYTWGKWEQNVIEFTEEWFMLSFSAKWLGQKYTKTYALPDFPGYKKGSHDDRQLVKKLWDYLDNADVVVAHNGDKFDIPKAFTRFAYYGLPPPSRFLTVDTRKVAKKFGFNGNALNELGMFLQLGKKLDHEGFGLWRGCEAGNPASWRKMKLYNAQDVILLEKVYLRFRPYMKNHPTEKQLERIKKFV